jgi:hypothetical protein
MTLKIAKLGGAASDVVVAKVAVRSAPPFPFAFSHTFIAWTYDDDLDAYTRFG